MVRRCLLFVLLSVVVVLAPDLMGAGTEGDSSPDSIMRLEVTLKGEGPVIDAVHIAPGRLNPLRRKTMAVPVPGQNRAYLLRLLDAGGELLYAAPFDFPRVQTVPMPAPDSKGKPSPDILPIDEPSASVLVPYSVAAAVIEIYEPYTSRPGKLETTAQLKNRTFYGPALDLGPEPDPAQQGKFHILIVASGYTAGEMSDFNSKAAAMKTYLLSKEPFKSYSAYVDIHIYGNTSGLGCAPGCANIDRLLCCTYSKVMAAARASGYYYDEIVIIHNTDTYCGGGSREYLEAYKTNSYDSYCQVYSGSWYKEMALHELGHSFGNLCDEYSYGSEGYTYNDCVNCLANCSTWSSISSACQQGCDAESTYYRPEDSTMIYLSVDHFNQTSLYATYSPDGLEERLIYFTGAAGGQVAVSGTILDGGGAALGDVTLTYAATGGGNETTQTLGNGTYSFSVSSGWSGTVTPSMPNYSFSPSSRSYSNVSTDRPNQDFTAQYSGSSATIGLDRSSLSFGGIGGGSASNAQTFGISNTGSGSLNWAVTADQNWLSCTPTLGSDSGTVSVSVNTSGLTSGTYTGTVSVSAANASNSPQTVTVTLKVYSSGASAVPFGEFATPSANTTVSSSIAVTGWALDDIGVKSVQVYSGSSYIGDAVFVEGARPDLEQAYSHLPDNSRAGWGYMLLTNFLPGGGNGAYTLNIYLEDIEGNRVLLGSKAITVDNLNAVKPFGAIDFPAQGGTVSGKQYVNMGWVLTPMPNKVPVDGSTISLYIDAILRPETAVYNQPRGDVSGLFPGYENSAAPGALFTFDTTGFDNGTYQIFWVATDNAGNADGIGSRFFTIQNSGSNKSNTNARVSSRTPEPPGFGNWRHIPAGNHTPMEIKRGFREDAPVQKILPGDGGAINLQLGELERVVVHTAPGAAGITRGYTLVGGNLRSLPTGSTLEAGTGTFYWQPGPGFTGSYSLLFIHEKPNGAFVRRHVVITVSNKGDVRTPIPGK